MKFSMTGQEKGDLLIQVTAWAGLTALYQITDEQNFHIMNVLWTGHMVKAEVNSEAKKQ
jgi:hypothetical protein